MVASTSAASSPMGIGTNWPATRMAPPATAHAATNHEPGSITTAGGGVAGTGELAMR